MKPIHRILRSHHGREQQRTALRFALIAVLASLTPLAAAIADTRLTMDESHALAHPTAELCQELHAIRVPDSIRGEHPEEALPIKCGTPLLVQAHQARGDGVYGALLAKLLARRVQGYSLVSPSGHFRVHYDLEGRGAVAAADVDGSGIPDYVEVVAAVLDSVWLLEVDQLGYQPPPSDQGAGGGDEYDVHVVQLGQGGTVYYGLTYPEQSGPTTSSYIEVDNDYTDASYKTTRGLPALRVTLAHEFFHAIQFGYYQGLDASWWQEATATWMEETAYPDADDYLQYLSAFLSHPERALDSASFLSSDPFAYGACLFPHLLTQRWDPDLVRQVWAEFGARQSGDLDHLDAALRRGVPGGLSEAMAEFAVWNYFTGPRYREGFSPEGRKYPAIRVHELPVETGAAARNSGWVDHLGTVYLRLKPGQREGGVVLGLAPLYGRWERQVLATTPDTVARQRPTTDPFRLAGWDRYGEVVLALTSQERVGSGYAYAVTAEYDSSLVDELAPVAARLDQNRPNPFRPDTQQQTLIPFALARPCASARLSLYAVDGQLVRQYELGPRPARAQATAWDGRDQHGALVASGVYYYVLEAGDFRSRRSLALVR